MISDYGLLFLVTLYIQKIYIYTKQ